MAESARIRAEQYLAPETLAQLAPFEMRAKMIVEGVMSGTHRSPYQGVAVEFAEHRQYVPGDEIRHLDWKVYGRSDKLYLKQYQQETNLDVVLMIDASGSMRYGSLGVKRGWGGTTAGRDVARWTKYDHATAICSALAYMCLQQRDRVGLAVFADEVRAQLRRSGSREQWRSIVRLLAEEPVDATTDLVRSVEQIVSSVTNRALFFIVSDFLAPPETVREALARFRHRRHDVVLVQVLDRQELRFDLDEPAPFVGLEGEGRLQVDPYAVRQSYLDALEQHQESLERTVRAFGYDLVKLDTHESVGPPLGALFGRRQALSRRSARG